MCCVFLKCVIFESLVKIIGFLSVLFYIRKFPNVIGAIDGCHIRITPKSHERVSFFNFKQFHSIHLQAVALFNRQFTDIFVR